MDRHCGHTNFYLEFTVSPIIDSNPEDLPITVRNSKSFKKEASDYFVMIIVLSFSL